MVVGSDIKLTTQAGGDIIEASSLSVRSEGGLYPRNDLIDPLMTDKLCRTNLQRMEAGIAPLGPDGNLINLRHMLQTQDGPIAELAQTFHQTNSKVIHINPSSIPSGIDRSALNKWRSDYWISRAGDFK